MTQTVQTLSEPELDRMRDFAGRLADRDVGVVVFDPVGQCVVDLRPATAPGQPEQFADLARRAGAGGASEAMDDSGLVAGRLMHGTEPAAVIVLQDLAGSDPTAGPHGAALLADLLAMFLDHLAGTHRAAQQIEKISSELALAYEELMLVYNMSTHMKVTQSSANYLQLAVDQVTQLVDVEGIAIFLEKRIDGMDRFVLTAGAGLVAIDQFTVDQLQQALQTELARGAEALLDSDVDGPFKYPWPRQVHSLIAVPLQGNGRMIGILVATNVVGKPDFDSVDVKLFNCVANQCAVFIENGRLFGDLKELFIGSLKALTNSIDAKDRYTRGHSERVAFISRWIAERLAEVRPVSEDQIHRIYLAGLLHDIGKIGVGEAVLCKKGALTEDERNRIKAHPRIGASILSDIKQMKDIVPGVLYHHERVDGKGYPEGLKGDQIPLISKIIGLADAFDAMTSRRVYRDAMSIRRALAEIEKGLGTQFDEEVGRVFLASDVQKLWDIIQDGFIESWDYSNFGEYGAVAVGTLIR